MRRRRLRNHSLTPPQASRKNREPDAHHVGLLRFRLAADRLRGRFANVLLTCQSGFESLLARELTELHGATVAEKGPGWVLAAGSVVAAVADRGSPSTSSSPEQTLPDLAFAHVSLLAPVEVRGDSVNALATQVTAFFLEQLRGERIEREWPNIWLGPHELVGLGRRISAVENAAADLLRKKLARVAKLATGNLLRAVGETRGLFVFFADFGRAFVSRHAFVHGPRRMADDALAPSRSYLKVEEAYLILGREPVRDETVCDLGAAPGGWSYSAAKHGARVVAIDNGPLKGGALDHPNIEHRREDAFRFAPAEGAFDWLFCDMVEEPHHVLRDIVQPWLARRWCRRFVVNLKFGRVDAVGLLRELRAANAGGPLSGVSNFRIRHLYHDREEFTLVGDVG